MTEPDRQPIDDPDAVKASLARMQAATSLNKLAAPPPIKSTGAPDADSSLKRMRDHLGINLAQDNH